MDLSARKDTIRRLILTRRGLVPQDEREARATAIVARLMDRPEVASARSLLAFVPYRSEPPIHGFLARSLERGVRLLLPYVADDGHMRASEVRALEELAPGYRGILEPRAPVEADPSEADVVVLPGVAFDEQGNRLGYGGGFFDSFLRACGDASRIGVCFDLQIVEEVPVGPHDEPVDVVVTEARTILATRKKD